MTEINKQPWLEEPDEVEFEHCGLKCKILRVKTLGHLCGYVGIPENHRFYKKSYDDLNEINELEVHGGLTFSDTIGNDGLWYFGFDAAHGCDLTPFMPLSSFRSSTNESREYRDMNYMKKECEKLAEFLSKEPK